MINEMIKDGYREKLLDVVYGYLKQRGFKTLDEAKKFIEENEEVSESIVSMGMKLDEFMDSVQYRTGFYK